MTMKKYKVRSVERAVFRAYDIRGIVGIQLDEDAFYSIGKAIAYRLNALGRTSVLLARDGRLSSASLAMALKQGVLDSGLDVIDLGAVATPVMYYATCETAVDSGLMVTGSHNPANYNGIKIVMAGKTLVEEDIALLHHILHAEKLLEGAGQSNYLNVIDEYMDRIVHGITLKRPFKVVVDCGNGIGGQVIPDVLRRLNCEVIELFCDVDGRFPNHHPDPTVEANLVDLKAAVAHHQADLGMGFDGDADRLGVVTNTGEVIWPDRLMMIYAKHLLKTNPDATIVYDVKCSSHLKDVILQAGGLPQMCPTGHSIVKRVMRESGALLAGEMSGHLFFKDRWYGFDDALYSACRLLEVFSASSLSVDEQCALVPDSVNTPEIKIPIFEEKKFPFMARFSTEANFPEARLIDIDGVRVEFAHGWGLVRASNTTPCLVARFEAVDSEKLTEIQALFKAQMQAIDAALEIPF